MLSDVRIALAAVLIALALLAFCTMLNAAEATVGVDPPTDGTRVLLTCNTIASVELTTPNPPPYTMSTKWATVRGSQRAEPCPATQEHPNSFTFTTEPRRNYIVSVRVRVYAADGTLISDRYPAPYYYFENGLAKPLAPTVAVLVGT